LISFQTVLQEIQRNFDLIDQRLAVIKKYAKYGNNAKGESTPTNPTKTAESEGKTDLSNAVHHFGAKKSEYFYQYNL